MIWSDEDAAAVEATLKFAIAIVPLAIVFAFIPQTRHFTGPVPVAQENDLPALVAAGPGFSTIFVRSLAGYASVHCKAAGWLPEVEDTEILSEAAAPAVADAGATATVIWANAAWCASMQSSVADPSRSSAHLSRTIIRQYSPHANRRLDLRRKFFRST